MIIRKFIYFTIVLILMFPYSIMAEIQIGPIHIYIYEFFILILFYFTLNHLLLSKGKIVDSRYTHLMGLMLFLLLIALIVGWMNNYKIASILKGIRPYVYMLSGSIVLVYGENIVKFKHIYYSILIGLLIQCIWGVYLVLNDPLSELILSGFRFPFRSGYWALFIFASLIFMSKDKSGYFSRNKKYYNYLSLFVVLIFVVLAMNRTIWISFFLMVSVYVIRNISIKVLLKILSISTIIIISLWFGMKSYSRGEMLANFLTKRLIENTMTDKLITTSWDNNRDRIFKSAFETFLEYPILGTGAGYTYSWKIPTPGKHEILISKKISRTDTSIINVMVRSGTIGLLISIYFIIVVWLELKKLVLKKKYDIIEEFHIVEGLYFFFPFLLLMSLNLPILFGYADTVILSILFAKVIVICYIPHNNSLCLIDKEVLNYYRQLLNKQGGKQ